MRRTVTTCLLLVSLLAALLAGGSPAGARPAVGGTDDLPSGFTDGEPVGGTDESTAPASEPVRTSPGTSTRAAPTRYFGQGPWDAIDAASSATTRCSSLSAAQLTALVVAPVFKEASAATSPSTAPAPMTLSRYDEWNGTYATTSNVSANYGLYAFRDPNTSYLRAYWHPGIGIWQYDSAGVGAPYTAIERMDVRVVAADVAAGMASRYCNPPPSVIGHSAPFTLQERRDAAWWPWWTASAGWCPLCQAEYDNMTASTPYFANVSLVAGISATGGAVRRSCTLAGASATIDCWYINPSVGVIQGATAWATLDPSGGSSTVAPTPLSRPFYVIKRNGYEERHWIKADTGYGIDISGKRLLGKNERPRSNQTGSGITWAASSGLCDRTVGRGSCGPVAPTNPVPVPSGVSMTSSTTSVGGSYRAVPLDANADGRGDVLWFAAGSAADHLWLGKGGGQFTSTSLTIGGPFDDVVALDVDGNGRDDILFNDRASGVAYLWRSEGDGTFTSSSLRPGAGRRPLVLDVDGTGGDEVFWYGAGTIGDALWRWKQTSATFVTQAMVVDGVFTPLVGDFDRNGRDDLFWYAPGSAADRLWLHRVAGGYTSVAVGVAGTYRTAVGDFDGDGGDDVVWYAPGSAADSIWFSGSGGAFTSQGFVVTNTYVPVVADLGGDGRDDVLWHAPNATTDLWTRWSSTRSRGSLDVPMDAPHAAVIGSFSGGGNDGILWYAAGPTTDAVWWR